MLDLADSFQALCVVIQCHCKGRGKERKRGERRDEEKRRKVGVVVLNHLNEGVKDTRRKNDKEKRHTHTCTQYTHAHNNVYVRHKACKERRTHSQRASDSYLAISFFFPFLFSSNQGLCLFVYCAPTALLQVDKFREGVLIERPLPSPLAAHSW